LVLENRNYRGLAAFRQGASRRRINSTALSIASRNAFSLAGDGGIRALRLELLSHRVIVSAARDAMLIGERLRALHEQKKMSQRDIEKRTGLLRCYISRAENDHSVPAIETLEKIAHAIDVPLYQLFCDGEKPPDQAPKVEDGGWGISGRNARTLARFCRLLSRASKKDQRFLLAVAQKMSRKKTR
jgi:transcriptional regulator with XRE-family HTH domain